MVGVLCVIASKKKNSKVNKEELHLQATVLLCIHIVRVLIVRRKVFNLCYVLGIWGCRVPTVSLGQYDLMRSLLTWFLCADCCGFTVPSVCRTL